MNFIKKSLVTLAAIAATVGALSAQESTDSTFDKSKSELSAFADVGLANAYFFPIGPKVMGPNLKYDPAIQADFGFSVGKFTVLAWGSGSPARGQVDEVDLILNYAVGSKDFNIGKLPFTVSTNIGGMNWNYADGLAGDKSDFLVTLSADLSSKLFANQNTSLNVSGMYNVVQNKVQNGGAVTGVLTQELPSLGPVDFSTSASATCGLDMYNLNGLLNPRLGANASVNLNGSSSLSLDYKYQFTGPKQSKEVIPQESIIELKYSIGF